jgi:ubiquitin-conjugating enzyme E2 S
MENQSPNVAKRISKGALSRLNIELADLILDPPEGIRLIPNEQNLFDIQAWIQGPEGFYLFNL